MKDSAEDFAWRVHSYLNEYIKFGDAKAGVLCGVTGALVVWLANAWTLLGDSLHLFWRLVGVGAIIFLALGFVLSLLAISPNLMTQVLRLKRRRSSIASNDETSPGPGFIFWRNVLAHPNANTYALEMARQSEADRIDHVSKHCYELATVADSKYRKIKAATNCLLIGLVAIVLFYCATKAWQVPVAEPAQTVLQEK